jgi:hypothetical protein
LLRYAVKIWKELLTVDRAIAQTIWRAYCAGEYPQRTSNLFHLGR